jgi:hypothetical protein
MTCASVARYAVVVAELELDPVSASSSRSRVAVPLEVCQLFRHRDLDGGADPRRRRPHVTVAAEDRIQKHPHALDDDDEPHSDRSSHSVSRHTRDVRDRRQSPAPRATDHRRAREGRQYAGRSIFSVSEDVWGKCTVRLQALTAGRVAPRPRHSAAAQPRRTYTVAQSYGTGYDDPRRDTPHSRCCPPSGRKPWTSP